MWSRSIMLAMVFAAVAWPARADTVQLWKLTPDPSVQITEGVSTEAVRWDDGTIRIYVSSPQGTRGFTSGDGRAFTPLAGSGARVPGSDPSLVKLPDGRWRLYYVSRESQGQLRILSAVSSDGVAWAPEPGIRLDISGPGRAGGVPEVVRLADGRTRIYYIPAQVGMEEIDSATSADGLSFAKDAGARLTGGYVDPAVVQLADGSFLGLFSTSPVAQQQLFVGRSSDGLAWTVDRRTVLDYAGNALDPTLLPLSDGGFRVYYSTSAQGHQLTGPFTVTTGILRQETATVPPATMQLLASVGPGKRIAFGTGGLVRAGTYVVVVHDRSKADNLHLRCKGVDRKTGTSFVGTVRWRVTLRPGTCVVASDATPTLKRIARVG